MRDKHEGVLRLLNYMNGDSNQPGFTFYADGNIYGGLTGEKRGAISFHYEHVLPDGGVKHCVLDDSRYFSVLPETITLPTKKCRMYLIDLNYGDYLISIGNENNFVIRRAYEGLCFIHTHIYKDDLGIFSKGTIGSNCLIMTGQKQGQLDCSRLMCLALFLPNQSTFITDSLDYKFPAGLIENIGQIGSALVNYFKTFSKITK